MARRLNSRAGTSRCAAALIAPLQALPTPQAEANPELLDAEVQDDELKAACAKVGIPFRLGLTPLEHAVWARPAVVPQCCCRSGAGRECGSFRRLGIMWWPCTCNG